MLTSQIGLFRNAFSAMFATVAIEISNDDQVERSTYENIKSWHILYIVTILF